MKKVLLSCMMLLGLGSVAYAEEVTVADGFGDEITSLDYITNGGSFVISNGTNAKFFLTNQNSDNKRVVEVPYEAYFCCTLEKVTDSGKDGENIYRILVKNISGENYPKGINGGAYLNTPNSGWSIVFAGDSKVDGGHKYGTDNDFLGLWYVTFDAENGFSFQNVGKATNGQNWPSWMTVGDLSGSQTYVKLYKSIEFTTTSNPIEKGTYDATDANTTFFADFKALTESASYDADTKVFKGHCGWQWSEGADFGEYQYIVLTVGENVTDGGWKVHIKDASNKEISGDEYGADYMNLWFGAWNNHNCVKIDLEKLRSEKFFDIHNIAEIFIEAPDRGLILGNAYATNQVPNNTKSWNAEENGDYKRTIGNNTFATICLPFEASVADAYVYEIASVTETGVSLAQYNGILKAGKAYIFKSNENESGNVYFYKATAATVEVPESNNGLMGTFTETKAPTASLVLSNNSLYTVDSDVTIAANKAWIDPTAVTSTSRGTVFLSFGEVTGIKAANVVETLNDSKVFDLQGRKVAQPKKGVYLVSGKKVVIK